MRLARDEGEEEEEKPVLLPLVVKREKNWKYKYLLFSTDIFLAAVFFLEQSTSSCPLSVYLSVCSLKRESGLQKISRACVVLLPPRLITSLRAMKYKTAQASCLIVVATAFADDDREETSKESVQNMIEDSKKKRQQWKRERETDRQGTAS